MATGRPSADMSICPTSGMRDEPPTSSTDRSSSVVTSADASARRMASTVSSSAGRIRFSNSPRVSRISVRWLGRATGMAVSVSHDRFSFASTHSRRRRDTAATVDGSSGSSRENEGPRCPTTQVNTASSK